MSNIHAVLLIPADGDPHGLLADGSCGARPPTVWRVPGAWASGDTAQSFATSTGYGGALVLAWDGKMVCAGCDRADWALHDARGRVWGPDRRTSSLVEVVLRNQITAARSAWFAALTGHLEPIGRAVFLDAECREVTP